MREGTSNAMQDFSMDFLNINTTMHCFVLPPNSNSHGILGSFIEKNHFLEYNMPLLELQMSLILITSHLTHFLLKPFGISDFVSSILAGIMLGPNGFGKYDFMREIIFPHDSQDTLNIAAMLGYNVYVFLAGVKMETGMILKIGRKALSISLISSIMPQICIAIYQIIYQKQFFHPLSASDYTIFVITTNTSIPMIAYVIDHLNLTNTYLGRLALSSALVGDFAGILIYAVRALTKTNSVDDAMRKLLPVLIFILVLTFLFRPVIDWVIRHTPNKKHLSTSFIYVVMAFAITSQAYFKASGQTQFLGPFIFGLTIPSGAPLGSALVEKFGSFVIGVLMHIVVVTAFMRADLYLVLSNFSNLRRFVVMILGSFLIKMVSCVTPSMILKMPIKEATALAFILNYIGAVGLWIGVMLRDNKGIKDDVYALIAFYILLNATIFPIIIKRLYNPSRKYEGYQGKNVLSMKPHNELKILTCIYGQEKVDFYIKLLNALHPTKESPINVYALHLLELTGRYVPIMVSHSKHKPISSSMSQNIICGFNQFEKNNWDSVSVQLFTSLSSFPLMHQDILDISLEKKTSLIILPLHRRWSIHGHIESEDKRWRSVNLDVLEKAPCSVGIFFNRGRFGGQRLVNSNSPNLSVCMIFFGGGDDRQALVIAKQMLKESKATLTVLHFLPKDSEDVDGQSKNYMYDNMLLDDIRHLAATNEHLNYRVYVVEDGPETVKILYSMVNEFDLLIVGRRFEVPTPQTSGLSEWSELPELGIMGDLLASKDLQARASVLVVVTPNS